MKKEHGVPDKVLMKMSKVEWPEGFKLGDAGEESLNEEGKGSTLKEDYTGKRAFRSVPVVEGKQMMA